MKYLAPRLLLLLVILALPWLLIPQSPPAPSSLEDLGGLEEREGIRILHLAGTPYEMGYAHGRALREEIRGLIQNRLYGELIPAAGYPPQLLMAYARLIDLQLSREFREELKGLAVAAGVSYLDLVLWNTLPQLALHPDPRGVTRELILANDLWLPPAPLSGFSFSPVPQNSDAGNLPLALQQSFIAYGQATLDGKLFQGLSWTLPVSADYLLVIIFEPEGKDAFLALSWPGAVGVLAGLNEEKISVAGLDWSSVDSAVRGVPLPFLLRLVLEESGDLDQALSILVSAPRTSGANVLLGDGKPAAALAVELTAHQWRAMESDADYLLRSTWPLHPQLSEIAVRKPENQDVFRELSEALETWQGRIDRQRAIALITRDSEQHSPRAVEAAVLAASDWELWLVVDEEGSEKMWMLNLLEEIEKGGGSPA